MADARFEDKAKGVQMSKNRSSLAKRNPYQRCTRPKVIDRRDERADEQFEASWLVSPMSLVSCLRSDKADATQTRAKARTLANTKSRDGREFPNTRTIIDRKENVDIYRKDETSIDWDWDSVGTTLITDASRNCYSAVREMWTGNASPCEQGIKATTRVKRWVLS